MLSGIGGCAGEVVPFGCGVEAEIQMLLIKRGKKLPSVYIYDPRTLGIIVGVTSDSNLPVKPFLALLSERRKKPSFLR